MKIRKLADWLLYHRVWKQSNVFLPRQMFLTKLCVVPYKPIEKQYRTLNHHTLVPCSSLLWPKYLLKLKSNRKSNSGNDEQVPKRILKSLYIKEKIMIHEMFYEKKFFFFFLTFIIPWSIVYAH